MKTLQYEQVYLSEYEGLADATGQIGHFLEAVYDQKRLHSSLGYLPPAEFQQACQKSRERWRHVTQKEGRVAEFQFHSGSIKGGGLMSKRRVGHRI